MKISPSSGGASNNFGQVTPSSQSTASGAKRAAAIAAARCEATIRVSPSDVPSGDVVAKPDEPKRIRMKTQASPDRGLEELQALADPIQESTNIPAEEQVNAAEATKPLDPQRAALAKQRRALQLKEREIADREKALANAPTKDGSEVIARLKSDPLSVLQEAGVSYDQLTEAILSNGSNAEISKLKNEIKALKEGVDNTFKDRDAQQEQQALNAMKQEAVALSKEGDAFELVRETNSVPKVVDLIHRTWKETGEILDVEEAMSLVENHLVDEYSKVAKLNKVQSQFVQPAPTLPQKQQARTLTNRDTARGPLSRRERALMAFQGQLKK